jgi:hypothetical protein
MRYTRAALLACLLVALAPYACAQDWPQFQQNAQRHGRASAGPAGPYRARWIWCGPQTVLRNHASRADWADDLTGRDGYSYPLPKSVPKNFAERMQPVHAGGVLYALDQEGLAYAIDIADGSTRWVGRDPGGSVDSPVIAGQYLICGSITGRITALNLSDGKEAWSLSTGRAITGSPALIDKSIYFANHSGDVYRLDADTGQVRWKTRLGGPCVGGIAADERGCYLGAEDKYFYALNAGDGSVRAKTQLVSQGFRMLWPVIHHDSVLVQVVGTVCVGSEHIFDDVLQPGTDPANEQRNIRRWLAGDDNRGAWKWASPDMKHLYVLDAATLKERLKVQHRPYLHTLYGLWLWPQRSGDWDTVQKYWPKIKTYYAAHATQAELYGELSAHIAIARLAHQFHDADAESFAVESARKSFTAALDYAATEKASLKYFNRLKESRHNFLASTNFTMLNLCPEAGRFLADHLKEPVLAKNDAIRARYPLWWLIAPPYESWAGNIGPDCEAMGLPREIFGMVYPIERWVAQTPPQTLAGYMASGADGIGDCYWLDSLVWTIESFGGQTRWIDARAR